MKEIHIVLAMDELGTIGVGNGLPWHCPADLKEFKAYTTGHPIIMGRKTFESIGRPLPGRENIVLTRQERSSTRGVTTVRSLSEAVEKAHAISNKAMVIGGATVYNAMIESATHVRINRMKLRVEPHEDNVVLGHWFFSHLEHFERVEMVDKEDYVSMLYIRRGPTKPLPLAAARKPDHLI